MENFVIDFIKKKLFFIKSSAWSKTQNATLSSQNFPVIYEVYQKLRILLKSKVPLFLTIQKNVMKKSYFELKVIFKYAITVI